MMQILTYKNWSDDPLFPKYMYFVTHHYFIFNDNNIRPHTSELNIHFIVIWIA